MTLSLTLSSLRATVYLLIYQVALFATFFISFYQTTMIETGRRGGGLIVWFGSIQPQTQWDTRVEWVELQTTLTNYDVAGVVYNYSEAYDWRVMETPTTQNYEWSVTPENPTQWS